VSELALALVLLVASGLTMKSFWRLQQVNPGFAADRVLALEMELPTDAKYRDEAEQATFFARVLAQVTALPGVTRAGVSNVLPLDSTVAKSEEFVIPNRPLAAGGQRLPADRRSVSADYFTTMGIPLRRGRAFANADRVGRPIVAVVDETLARRYFDALDPVGQKIHIGRTDLEIVGVVGAVKQARLDREATPTIYLSYLQVPEFRMDLVVQTAGDPASMVNAVKNAIYSVDKDQPVYKIRTMAAAVSGAASSQRLTLGLLALFAAVAFALAAVGIYGVVAYTVAQRTREIGIRLALGAEAGRIVRMIVVDGLTTTMAGVGAGLILAAATTRALAAILFGVSAYDLGVFGMTAAALATVAVIASYIPAHRAACVDPVVALRAE
jgi:putative ABC transport system permease protein